MTEIITLINAYVSVSLSVCQCWVVSINEDALIDEEREEGNVDNDDKERESERDNGDMNSDENEKK